jgi:hypothetical protein
MSATDSLNKGVENAFGPRTCKDLGGTGSYSHNDFACSECGCTIAIREYFACVPTMFLADGSIAKPRYCPNCGRRVVQP